MKKRTCSDRLYGFSGVHSSSLNGGKPHRQMYSTTPIDHMSTACEYWRVCEFCRISGAT